MWLYNVDFRLLINGLKVYVSHKNNTTVEWCMHVQPMNTGNTYNTYNTC